MPRHTLEKGPSYTNYNKGTTPGGWSNFADGASGLSDLANVYLGFKSLSLAKDQFAFGKNSFNANLANSQSAFNTNLEDRQRARIAGQGVLTGQAASDSLASYTQKNSLKQKAI